MIVSVHLPKTAGSSFRSILQNAFGDRLLLDYDDRPLAQAPDQRNQAAIEFSESLGEGPGAAYDCVHGHFLPLKYASLADTRFVTWMRDPVERVVSHYLFWRRNWENDDIAPRNPELRQMIETRGTFPPLETFIELPAFHNVCTQFMWGFDVERFDCIGFVETWQVSLEKMSAVIGLGEIADVADNINPDRDQAVYDIDPGLRRQIAAFNAGDAELYNWAFSKFG